MIIMEENAHVEILGENFHNFKEKVGKLLIAIATLDLKK